MRPKESYRSARAAYGKQIEVPAKMLPESPAVSVTLIIVRLASTVVTLVTVKVFATLSPWQRRRSRGDVERLCAYTLALPKPTAQLEAMLERLDANAYIARSHVHLGLAWLTS